MKPSNSSFVYLCVCQQVLGDRERRLTKNSTHAILVGEVCLRSVFYIRDEDTVECGGANSTLMASRTSHMLPMIILKTALSRYSMG